MQLTEHFAGTEYAVRDISDDGILIGTTRYTTSVLIGPDFLDDAWPVTDAADLAPEHFDKAQEWGPELIVLGTGERQVFPPAAVQHALLGRGIGLEVMTNPAAARTFNVVMSEDRRALLGVIWKS